MAQEDKSVRKLVQEIEARTGKLDAAIEKLSDSLNRISESLAKPKEDGPGREELIQKFKQPFATPEAVKSQSNSEELLDQIKDAIVFNQKDNFSLFKSIDATLRKIEEKGGILGGSDFNFGRGGPRTQKTDPKKTPATTDRKDQKVKPTTQAVAADKATSKAEQKAAGKAATGIGGALARGARFIPGVGLAIAGGMAAMDAYSSASEAEKVLDIEDREATLGEKVSAGAGGLVEGLTFGLVNRSTAAKGIESARQGIAGLFTGGAENKEPVSTAGAIASANLGRVGPDFKYIEEQRKKREAQQTTKVSQPTAEPLVKPAPKPQTEAPIVASASTVTGETKDTTLPDGVTKDPISGAYKYKEVMFQATSKEAIDAHVKAIDSGGEATFKDTDRNTGMLVEKTITSVDGGVKIVGKELTPSQPSVSLPTPSTTPSQTVNQMSQENVDMREGGQAVQPVVINNSSAVTTSTQTFTPLRATARPNNNSFERKQNMAASY